MESPLMPHQQPYGVPWHQQPYTSVYESYLRYLVDPYQVRYIRESIAASESTPPPPKPHPLFSRPDLFPLLCQLADADAIRPDQV